jgi:hypothetical protein
MNITLKITETTDGKFVGSIITYDGVSVSINGFTFEPHQVVNLGSGRWRIHNSHYSVDCIEVEE